MSIRAQKNDHAAAPLAEAFPEWVLTYFTPSAPANRVEPPHQSALDQMYAYYDA